MEESRSMLQDDAKPVIYTENIAYGKKGLEDMSCEREAASEDEDYHYYIWH